MTNKTFFVLALNIMLFTLACNKNMQENPQDLEMSKVSKVSNYTDGDTTGYTDEEVENFKRMLVEFDLVHLSGKWSDALVAKDYEEVYATYLVATDSLQSLKNKWKGNFDDMVLFIAKIEKRPAGEHDGNPCTKNKDGTIYTGTCTFFGKVMVFIHSISCGGMLNNLDLMDEKQRKHQMTKYDDCVQKSVCNIC